jgi:hypothetical protein
MVGKRRRAFVFVVVAAAWPCPRSGAQPAPGEPQTFLRKHVQLDAAQLAALDRGEVVTRLLPSTETREVVAFGAVRIRATRAGFLERFRDVVAFKKSASIPEAGLFGKPPRLEDVAALTLDPEDIDSLKSCTKGDCDVKLPVSIMERFRREVSWSAPDARARATALAKQMAVEYVTAYLAGGSAAMGEYHDKKKPLAMATEFQELIRRSPYVFEYVPALHKYLEEFPRGRLEGAEDVVYWSKEKFGLKPVVAITHVTIYPGATKASSVIATKQIYATHYFQASLGLTAVVDAAGTDGREIYLLELNRTRIDPPTGLLAGVARSQIAGRVEKAMAEGLKSARARMTGGAASAR